MYGNSTYEDSQNYICDKCGEIMAMHELGYWENLPQQNGIVGRESECYCEPCWELKKLEL